MKAFMEEYGFSILAVIVIVILIDLCTPVGSIVKSALSDAISVFSHKEETTYKVSLFAGDGKFEDNSSLKTLNIKKGEEVGELPIPFKEGYVFSGWWDESYGGNHYTVESIINEDINLYARWKTGSNANIGSGMNNGHLWINDIDVGAFEEGSEFEWKNYDWIVLEIKNNTALIISKYVLDENYSKDTFSEGVKYNVTNNTVLVNSKNVSNCYNGSHLDTYMEGFYSVIQDNAIVESALSIGLYNDEYAYTTVTVARHIFALSYSETKQYFASNNKRIAYNDNIPYSYWTRSGANLSNANNDIEYEAYAVFSDGAFINNEIENRIGARPSMYVDLTKIDGVNIK